MPHAAMNVAARRGYSRPWRTLLAARASKASARCSVSYRNMRVFPRLGAATLLLT
jgi:hypothetical protein